MALAPALGYLRASELAQAMVTPSSENTVSFSFSYVSPGGQRREGLAEEVYHHRMCVEKPFEADEIVLVSLSGKSDGS
ncbi:uncharacterized protein I303_100249 [Kwoniella dejecticola CBS 10117]|uniref:Uncharacterized protein n=1 Tax=Kwoniella dejecticola CBS 10117 TaxID=1296121 RepID=A0A1A6AEG3_9TREE|nr:uncharacterized protein I303_00251 [Kwoniella dejecticola CBS 10117]OBR88434.1 hypothetical protein I303_00251 [Kwoniella dejecticola CBS 10117]